MKIKKIFMILVLIIIIPFVFATGCSTADSDILLVEENEITVESNQQSKESNETSIDNRETPPTESNELQVKDNSRISFMVQEYKGDNIAEIPYIEYDGEMNPEIDSINRSNNQGIRQIYDDFINNAEEYRWIEIRSYPFTSENYLQVVVTYCEYPIYGTDGNIFSINYDRKAGKAINANDIMIELGLNPEEVEETLISMLYTDNQNPLDSPLIKGFIVNEDTDGKHIQLLLEVLLETPGAESWKTFYAYEPKTNELYQLDKNCLFDPDSMDKMNPPLSYELAND